MKNDFRQKLHLEPTKGWLNDPNGLSFFKGKYHIYFQYCPDSPYGNGNKCWGHWESSDLINWVFCGTAIRPDCPEDKNGAYSGCGIVSGDTLHIFYTGNVKNDGDYDYITAGREANVIHIATKDGRNMSEKRVLLRNSDYPKNCSCHVRDPKVWEENGKFYMVLGARTLDDKGCVLYYASPDLLNWTFEKAESRDGFGYMWECPDVIELCGNKYLSISPQGLAHGELSHQNIYSSGYFKGDEFIEWDYGFDFYAPQTFTAPDGRKIIIGWMGIGDIPYTNPTAELGWQHCLTMPRELVLKKDGEIYQKPLSELQLLRRECREIEANSSISAELPFELTGKICGDFSIKSNSFSLSYEDSIFTLEFLDMKVSGGRTSRRVRLENLDEIRIFADTSSLEIYLNGGKRVISSRFYPEDTEIELLVCGLSGKIYRLDGIKVTKGTENE